jgi:hypothetical protein
MSMKRLGDPVLAFCAKDPQTRVIIDRAPAGLYGRLSAGDVPSFLTLLPVTGGSELRLFRLRSGAIDRKNRR